MNYPNDTGTGTGREVRCNMATSDDLLPDVKHYMPGCNVEITMRKEIANVIQTFCRETGVFIYTADDITVVDQQRKYEVPLMYQADILMFRKIEQYSLDSDGNKEDYASRTFHPSEYEVVDDLQEYNISFKLNNALGASSGSRSVLVAEVSLIPMFDPLLDSGGCALPNKFMQRWRQAFVAGTISNLASMKGRNWTDEGLALTYSRIYSTLHSEALDKASISKMIQGSGTMVSRTKWV